MSEKKLTPEEALDVVNNTMSKTEDTTHLFLVGRKLDNYNNPEGIRVESGFSSKGDPQLLSMLLYKAIESSEEFKFIVKTALEIAESGISVED